MKYYISFTMVFILLFTLTATGQDNNGSISGLVLGQGQKSPLPGTNVVIKALNIGTTTDFDGNFLLTAVPEGKHELKIYYLGFITKTIEIDVISDENLNLGRILLAPSVNDLGEVIVTASIEGQQKAYNQQRNSDQIKTIVSADLVNQFPDINVSEALQRVPGVNIERNNGEGANIRVRGTPRNYTTVSIDGAQLPTTDGDDRTEALDLIPAELLSSLEISKSLLPENDGDAIGGAVNLKTPTARSKDGRIKGTLAGGYATIFDRGTTRAKLRYDKRSKNDKFGVIVGGSFYNTVNGEERFEGNWRRVESGSSSNPEEIIALNELELRPLLNLRTRFGANTTLDYKFSDNSEIFLTGSFNALTDESERYRIRFRAREDFPEAGNPLVVGSEEDSDGRFRRDMADVHEQRENLTITFGGNHVINNSGKLDYGYSYSQSEREETSIRSVFRAQDIVYDIDLSERDFPQFIPRNFDVNDYSLYEFGGYQLDDPRRIKGTNQTIFVNYEQPINLGSKITSSIKTGGKLRFQENTRSLNNTEYGDYNGFYTMDQVVGDDQGSIFGGRYDMGRFPSPSRAARHFRDNFDLYQIDPLATFFNTESERYETQEDIFAWYGQGKIDFGKLSGVFGVRYESTETLYVGNVIDQLITGEVVSNSVEGGLNYDFFLPSMSFRYKLTDRTNLRASYFESFARPNFIDLVPSEIRNFANAEVRRGNPELVPAYARNLDFMFEHYFKKDGTFSLGLFYKNIDNFIFQQRSIIADDPIVEGFQLIQSVNGDTADVLGVEVAFSKKFTFLPGFLNGFGVYANYTYVDSSSSFQFTGEEDGEPVSELREDVPLIGQADHTWNASLYYDKGKFSARTSLNYNSRSFLSFDIDPFNDFILEERYQLDANASYKITDDLTIFVEAQNLTDEPVIEFNQERSRVSNYEIYGISARMGVNFNF
ncbi:MAG: TonB-dependent receptor [Bacteroidetes bacterium]|nr:TonB-dependent receptor [Bacteroidota bacterium]